MQLSVLQNTRHFSIAACREIIRLLNGLHLPAILIDNIGKPYSLNECAGEGLCENCPSRNTQLMKKLSSEEGVQEWIEQGGMIEDLNDQGKIFLGACPRQGQFMMLPVHEDFRRSACLFVCLNSLAQKKTEAFQRTCDRFGVDSELFFRNTLGQTFSSERTASLVSVIIQHLIGRSMDLSRQNGEIEALSQSLVQCYEELALLHKMTDNMRLTQDLNRYFDQLVSQLSEVLECNDMLLFWNRQNNSGRKISPDDFGDLLPSVTSCRQISFSESQFRYLWDRALELIENNKPYLIDGSVDSPMQHRWPDPIKNVILMPIQLDRKVFGFLVAVNKQTRPDFNSIDVKLLDLVAVELAVFLENRSLYDDMQELLLGSLGALTNSIDAKDPYTCGHSQRVALISRSIAERIGLSPQQIDTIYLAGLLHDVGKIGVSEAVLCKPGRLTDDEYEQIKKHPQIGFNILKEIKQMAEVRETVLSHHERYDGRGYPRGLRGTEIPLSGRIVMLADSFDAMISNRHYRNAMPLDMALAEIRRFSGTQFDPELAEVFLQPDMDNILTEYQLAAAN